MRASDPITAGPWLRSQRLLISQGQQIQRRNPPVRSSSCHLIDATVRVAQGTGLTCLFAGTGPDDYRPPVSQFAFSELRIGPPPPGTDVQHSTRAIFSFSCSLRNHPSGSERTFRACRSIMPVLLARSLPHAHTGRIFGTAEQVASPRHARTRRSMPCACVPPQHVLPNKNRNAQRGY